MIDDIKDEVIVRLCLALVATVDNLFMHTYCRHFLLLFFLRRMKKKQCALMFFI